MNWRSRAAILSPFFAVFCLSGCGVKGDPLPPLIPAELGRGRPTYKRATEGLRIQHNQDVNTKVDEGEDDENGHD
jgi:hypothetical protein